MSPRESQPSTKVDVRISVGHAESEAEVAAMRVDKIDGDVHLFTPAHVEAPSEESIVFYLHQIEQEIPPPDKASPAMRRLWHHPFCAKVPGPTAIDLYDEVRRIFEQDRELKRIQRVIVLADAGMGKTPALYYLRMKRARHSLGTYRHYRTRRKKGKDTKLNVKTFIIPLFIRLSDLRIGLSIRVLVRDTFNACIPREASEHRITSDQANVLLKERTCLILLDDLDELLSEHHKGGIQAITQFMETYPHHQFVISCRKSSYREQLGYLDELYLDDLTEDQVEEVLREALDDEHFKRLNPSLLELARNRAMLYIILDLLDKDESKLLDKDGSTQQPVNRGQLLRRRNYYLLGVDKADTSEKLARLEMEEGLLERLAYAMQRDHTRSYSERQVMAVVREYLEEWHERYTWREVVTRLREKGILERDVMRQWRFSDRDIAAYFAAAAVLYDPASLEPILEEVSDLWWRDMLEILIGLQQEPTDLFFELIDRDALVAAHCIHSAGRAADNRMEDALVDALLERMAQENSTRRKYIVERIGESDHPRAPEALLRWLDREWSSLVVMAIAKSLWRWEGDEPILRWAHRSPESAVELGQKYDGPLSGSNEARLAELMRDPEQSKQIRGISAVFLGSIGTDNARSELLKLLVDEDVDDYVGWCVAEALTQIDHQDVQDKALSLYQDQRYQDERWEHHRARAVYLLGWVSRRLENDKLLIEALKAPDSLVRCYAIDAMARLDLPNAREQIEQLLAAEQDPKVLRKAGETLGQIGTIDSISVLQTYLRHERTRTRWMMRRAIAEILQRHAL